MTTSILLNELLNLRDLGNVKIRFNKQSNAGWNPIELFKNGETSALLQGQYWDYLIKVISNGANNRCLIRLDQPDLGCCFTSDA